MIAAVPEMGVPETGVPKVELRAVRKSFGPAERRVQALADVSLRADAAEFVALIGPSGCGKSTIFNVVAGLAEPSAGEVLLDGQRPASRLGLVGHMPQKDLLLPWRTVLDNVVLGLELRGVEREAARREALAHFPAFGLDGFADRYPATLSGGMRQRAAFLRTLLLGRDVLLLDEPFGALDALTRAEMQEWLLAIWERLRPTVIFITHDVDEALLLSDRVYVLSPRPAVVRRELRVDLPRPRRYDVVTTPAFAVLKASLLAALRPEAQQPARAARETVGVALAAAADGAGRSPSRLAADEPAPAPPPEPAAGPAPRGARLREHAAPTALALGLLLLWEVAVRAFAVPGWLLPPPSGILAALYASAELIARHTLVTLAEVLVGFAASFALGVGLALAIVRSRLVERAIYPFIVASQTVPVVAIAPLLLIWLGYGLWPKAVVVALICFFPIVVNTVDGFRSVDPELVSLLRSMGARRRGPYAPGAGPAALPYLLSGTKVAVAVSVIGAVIGEWVGAQAGLGYLMVRSAAQFQTARVFAAIVVLSVVGITLFGLVALLERWALAHRRAGESGGPGE